LRYSHEVNSIFEPAAFASRSILPLRTVTDHHETIERAKLDGRKKACTIIGEACTEKPAKTKRIVLFLERAFDDLIEEPLIDPYSEN